MIKTQQGFSLIEVVLVVMIVGLTLVLFSNLPNSLNLIGISDHTSLAKDIATKQIEFERLRGFSVLVDGTSSISDPRIANLPTGSATSVVEPCPSDIYKKNESIKKVTVTVSWQDKGQPKSVSLVTLISQGGLQ